jgi:hypothetical protein
VTWILVLDSAGTSVQPMPIPNVPAFAGRGLWFQWVVLEPGGKALGAFSLSDCLLAVLGAP